MRGVEKQNKKIFINTAKFNKVMFSLLIVGFIYYVTGVNDLAVKGFKLQELKKQAMSIDSDNKELELKVMNLSSYNKLAERVDGLSMVPTGDVSYITIKDNVVAKK